MCARVKFSFYSRYTFWLLLFFFVTFHWCSAIVAILCSVCVADVTHGLLFASVMCVCVCGIIWERARKHHRQKQWHLRETRNRMKCMLLGFGFGCCCCWLLAMIESIAICICTIWYKVYAVYGSMEQCTHEPLSYIRLYFMFTISIDALTRRVRVHAALDKMHIQNLHSCSIAALSPRFPSPCSGKICCFSQHLPYINAQCINI